MRRGYSLVELLVALAVLATLGTITLRLTFAGDRALQTHAAMATANGAAARLLQCVSDDLRAARSVSRGQPLIIGRADGRATYSPLSGRGGIRRTTADTVEDYLGVRLSVTGSGRMRTVTISVRALTLRTVVCQRGGGS